MAAFFGVAGNPEAFYDSGGKSSLEMPEYLAGLGVEAYEYQCGKGVKISEDSARVLGERAVANKIVLSIHAPYFISLSSVEEEKRLNSVKYILQTLAAAKNMGADRIVVHSGSCGKITRREAMKLAKSTLSLAISEADKAGFGEISICPETMGKVNQLGNVAEVMELCKLDERLIPTIDFGHVNAQTLGSLKKKEDFEAIFDAIKNSLGSWRAERFHAHYSRIEYTNAGEKKHHTFAETEYEPEFEPIAQIIAERELSPTIICESHGTQGIDAVAMKELYIKALKNNG